MNEQTFKLIGALAAVLGIIASILTINQLVPRLRAWKSVMRALYALKTKLEGYRIPAITYSFRYEVVPIVSVSLFLNVIGWGITSRNPSILYLDMTGTAATSFLLGPWWGAIVGILTNIINAKVYPANADVVLAPWMLVNLTGGIFWGLMARTVRFRQYVRNPSNQIFGQAKSHFWYLFWFGVAGAAVMALAGTTVSVAVGNDPLILAPSEAFGGKIQHILKGLDDYIQKSAAIGGSEIAPNILSALLRWGVTTLRYIPDKTISAAVGLLTAKYMFPVFEESLLPAEGHRAIRDNWLTPATAILVYTAIFPWGAINSQPQLWLWCLPFVILFVGCVYESSLGSKSQIVMEDRVQRVRRYIAARCQLVPDEAFGAIVVAVLISSLIFMSGLFLVGSNDKGTIGFSFLKAILAYLVGFYLLRISVRQWAARILWESPQASNRSSECEELNTNSEAEIQSKVPEAPQAAGRRLPKYSLTVALIGFIVFIGVGVRYYFVKSKKPITSIAVMPFTYETGNPELESIADGMTLELISTLTQLQNLTVKPRNSVFGYKGKEYNVTGVIEDCPSNSQFRYNFLVSFKTLEVYNPEVLQEYGWYNNSYYTYLLLKSGQSPPQLQSKFPRFLEKYMGVHNKEWKVGYAYFLQPLTSIHLQSHLRYEIGETSSVGYVVIFATIASMVPPFKSSIKVSLESNETNFTLPESPRDFSASATPMLDGSDDAKTPVRSG